MKIFAQMDDIFTVNINSDSTFALLLEAQNRGHDIYYYLPQDLAVKGNTVSAYVNKIQLQRQSGNHCRIIKSSLTDLRQADIILFRQDPPFNSSYITTTYALEKIKDEVLIVNNPTEIRNCPEKIFITNFEEITPPTIITSNLKQLQDFKKEYGNIIIKPLYGSGGEAVLHLKEDDNNLEALHQVMIKLYQAPFVAQKYIREVTKGDKRILLLDGSPIGAVNRVAPIGSLRSNLHVGGSAYKSDLTDKEIKLCKKIGPELKKRGLIFVGIDVIGDYITEINVTSPTCIQEVSRLNKTNIADLVWQCLEAKL